MPRRILEGNVISTKTNKTVTVLVERRYMHPVYKKYIKSTQKFTAHDESNSCQDGERVQIIECRPISKTKRWAVLRDGKESIPPTNNEKRKLTAKNARAKGKAEPKPAAAAGKAEEKKPKAKKPAAEKKSKAKKDA